MKWKKDMLCYAKLDSNYKTDVHIFQVNMKNEIN